MRAFAVVCFLSVIFYLSSARSVPLNLDTASVELSNNNNWKCGRYIVLTTMPSNVHNGIRLRGAFVALSRPKFLHVFIRSTQSSAPFETISSNDIQSSSENIPNVVSSKEVAPLNIHTFKLGTNEFSDPQSTESISEEDSQFQSRSQEETKVASGSSSATEEFQKGAEGESTHEPLFAGNDERFVTFRPFFFRKMLFPIEGSSSSFNRWSFIRAMQLKALREGDERGEFSEDGSMSANALSNEIIQNHEDGSMSYHKSGFLPQGHFSVDVFSTKPFIPVSKSSDMNEEEEKPAFIQSALDSFDSFYNSIFGSIFIGVGCGLILSMLSFFILSIFFPEENDEERTVFILSTSQSPTTPLLDEAISSDSESVSNEGNSPEAVKYQPPHGEY